MNAFEEARDLLSAVIAAYSSAIPKLAEGERAQRMTHERATIIRERQGLTPGDSEMIARIMAEYPELLRRVRQVEA